MNVLLTCAGRRVSLLRLFLDAAHSRGGRALAADTDPLAPTLFIADEGMLLPPLDSRGYAEGLIEAVSRHHIQLVVPTIDPELPVLAALQTDLARLGCKALVSSADMIRVTGDKWLTFEFLNAAGIETPKSWLPHGSSSGSLPPRLFVKPRFGSASKDTFAIGPDGLSAVLGLVSDPIIQEFAGGPEITVDALFDFEGTLLHYVPRRRIRTLAGESVQGLTIPDDEITNWLEHALTIIGSHGAQGPMTVQAFLTDTGPLLTEINPRFGGGFPLSHAAGARYPEWILGILAGEGAPARLREYQRGLYMTRYQTEHFEEEPYCGG